MIEAALDLVVLFQAWLTAGVCVFLRVGGCFLVLPGFGDTMIPMRVRLGAALAISVLLTPLVLPEIEAEILTDLTMWIVAAETLSGLIIGLALRLTVHALQIAGSIAAHSTSLAQIMGGASPDPQPAIGAILMLSGITLAVLSGLHIHLVAAFARSYEVLPFGVLPLAADLGGWGVDRVAASFGLALSLAAPFLIGSLLYNVALGVINKAMPQLMVAFVGAPAITWGGLFLLLVSMPFILPVWLSSFDAALSFPLRP
jgi:flagellar biosynthetic protein FliR